MAANELALYDITPWVNDFDCAKCHEHGSEKQATFCDGCDDFFHNGRCFELHVERSDKCREVLERLGVEIESTL